jgi:hypothetical protein
MYNDELQNNTKKLLKDLNYFIVHIFIYLVTNTVLIAVAFNRLEERWWLFIVVIGWAFGIMYHALKVYGVELMKKKANKMMSWV